MTVHLTVYTNPESDPDGPESIIYDDPFPGPAAALDQLCRDGFDPAYARLVAADGTNLAWDAPGGRFTRVGASR